MSIIGVGTPGQHGLQPQGVTIQLRPNMDSTRYKSPGLTYLLTYLRMDCILNVTWPLYDYK